MITITYKGETHNIEEWSKITGISRDAIKNRLKRGWDVEDMLTVPVKPSRRGRKGNWKIENETLTKEQITDDAAINLCDGMMRQLRKDLKQCMKRHGNTLNFEEFFDSALCGTMLECLGVDCDGEEIYRQLYEQIKEEL